jgi:hypothetical protein
MLCTGMRQIGLVAGHQNRLGALSCKCFGNGQANAFGAASDEDALSSQF